MQPITLVEVAPRDGLQNERVEFDTERKIELIERAVRAGARRIETTSFVNPHRVPQMADAEELMAAVPRDRGAAYIGLVLNRRGAERAVAAGCDEVNFVVVASETFNRRNQSVGTFESLQTWREIRAIVREANLRTSITIGAAFGCPFEGVVLPERVLTLIEELRRTGDLPDEIALADTIGVGVPTQVEELFRRTHELAPQVQLRGHFHNTRNTAIANALAAARNGAQALDGSLGGIGGCPFAPAATGNVATEDLIYVLERCGYQTGCSLEATIDAARWLGTRLDREVPGMLSRAGTFPHPEHCAPA